MKQHTYMGYLVVLICILACSCQKYDTLQPISGAACIRLFNNIVNYKTSGSDVWSVTNTRVLCVLVDPKQEADGSLGNALMAVDFLSGRALYAAPYETHPNEDISTNFNIEYPGAVRTRTGGVINGLDLSRWTQIAPGSHRVVIMRRQVAGSAGHMYFKDMTPAIKDTACLVAIDTTITFDEGGVYTLEILNQSMADALPLQLRIRRESLDRQRFAADSLYVNFYNYMQAPGTPSVLDVYYQTDYVTVTDQPLRSEPGSQGVPISYSPQANNGSGLEYTGIRTPEQKLTTITEKFAATASYIAIPMPPADSFYYSYGPGVGLFRVPMDQPHIILNFYLAGQSAATGARPYLQMPGNEYYGKWSVNTNNVNSIHTSGFMPLYQVATMQGITSVMPLINTITLMNGVSDINKPVSTVTAFQSAVQRPY